MKCARAMQATLIITPPGGLITDTAMTAAGGSTKSDPGAFTGKYFHPKGKLQSTFTIEAQKYMKINRKVKYKLV